MTRRRSRLIAVSPTRADGGTTRRANRRVILAVASAAAALVGIGGLLGVVVAAVSAVGLVLTGRSRPAPTAVAEDVAIVLELIAGCLMSGLSMVDALQAAADAGDHVTREACLRTAVELRRGAGAAQAWAPWTQDVWLAAAARVTTRTTDSGAAVADDLTRTASRIRGQRRAMRQERVQRAGVWVVLPLGLCFLPAFVLVAVVPLVIGLFASMH
jgi:pilus assembly protein TadC